VVIGHGLVVILDPRAALGLGASSFWLGGDMFGSLRAVVLRLGETLALVDGFIVRIIPVGRVRCLEVDGEAKGFSGRGGGLHEFLAQQAEGVGGVFFFIAVGGEPGFGFFVLRYAVAALTHPTGPPIEARLDDGGFAFAAIRFADVETELASEARLVAGFFRKLRVGLLPESVSHIAMFEIGAGREFVAPGHNLGPTGHADGSGIVAAGEANAVSCLFKIASRESKLID